jgi:hypothetical protein
MALYDMGICGGLVVLTWASVLWLFSRQFSLLSTS